MNRFKTHLAVSVGVFAGFAFLMGLGFGTGVLGSDDLIPMSVFGAIIAVSIGSMLMTGLTSGMRPTKP